MMVKIMTKNLVLTNNIENFKMSSIDDKLNEVLNIADDF